MSERLQPNPQALQLASATVPASPRPLAGGSSAQRPSSTGAAAAALVRVGRSHAPAAALPAVAAGSFAMGAALVSLARRRHPGARPSARRSGGRAPVRRMLRRNAPTERMKVVASRSVLVDVHLLERIGS